MTLKQMLYVMRKDKPEHFTNWLIDEYISYRNSAEKFSKKNQESIRNYRLSAIKYKEQSEKHQSEISKLSRELDKTKQKLGKTQYKLQEMKNTPQHHPDFVDQLRQAFTAGATTLGPHNADFEFDSFEEYYNQRYIEPTERVDEKATKAMETFSTRRDYLVKHINYADKIEKKGDKFQCWYGYTLGNSTASHRSGIYKLVDTEEEALDFIYKAVSNLYEIMSISKKKL